MTKSPFSDALSKIAATPVPPGGAPKAQSGGISTASLDRIRAMSADMAQRDALRHPNEAAPAGQERPTRSGVASGAGVAPRVESADARVRATPAVDQALKRTIPHGMSSSSGTVVGAQAGMSETPASTLQRSTASSLDRMPKKVRDSSIASDDGPRVLDARNAPWAGPRPPRAAPGSKPNLAPTHEQQSWLNNQSQERDTSRMKQWGTRVGEKGTAEHKQAVKDMTPRSTRDKATGRDVYSPGRAPTGPGLDIVPDVAFRGDDEVGVMRDRRGQKTSGGDTYKPVLGSPGKWNKLGGDQPPVAGAPGSAPIGGGSGGSKIPSDVPADQRQFYNPASGKKYAREKYESQTPEQRATWKTDAEHVKQQQSSTITAKPGQGYASIAKQLNMPLNQKSYDSLRSQVGAGEGRNGNKMLHPGMQFNAQGGSPTFSGMAPKQVAGGQSATKPVALPQSPTPAALPAAPPAVASTGVKPVALPQPSAGVGTAGALAPPKPPAAGVSGAPRVSVAPATPSATPRLNVPTIPKPPSPTAPRTA